MKKLLFIMVMSLSAVIASAQDRYFTRNANITFYSDAPLEKIEGKNSQATSVLDAKTGQIEFAVLMKAFEFEKSLMQEHFNENYVESGKYPKANFKGTITNMSAVDLTKDGSYPVKVKGQMTLHGVTNETSADGVLDVKGGKITGKSTFNIALADYKIAIPSLVKDKVSREVKVTVVSAYDKM